ncbi:hypothetical protein OIU78_022695 [Salix suchowensis]|nr:hypothetical protein OIU78_022695 [Salix suchowensis]
MDSHSFYFLFRCDHG